MPPCPARGHCFHFSPYPHHHHCSQPAPHSLKWGSGLPAVPGVQITPGLRELEMLEPGRSRKVAASGDRPEGGGQYPFASAVVLVRGVSEWFFRAGSPASRAGGIQKAGAKQTGANVSLSVRGGTRLQNHDPRTLKTWHVGRCDTRAPVPCSVYRSALAF